MMARMLTMTCESDVDGVVLEEARVDGVVGSSGSDVQDGVADEFGMDGNHRDVPSFSMADVALRRMNS